MFSSKAGTGAWEKRQKFSCLSGGVCREEYQIWNVRRRQHKENLVCVLGVRKLISEEEIWTLFSLTHMLIHAVQKAHDEREM